MWQKTDYTLYQKFKFKDFDEAFIFMERVAEAARVQNHHPKIINNYNIVELWLSTHSAGDTVTDKDHQLAKAIDEAYESRSEPQSR